MSSGMETAQSQWLAQLASMRQAIAELKLDKNNSIIPSYGQDLVLDDDLTGGSGSDDIWDILSEEEDDGYSSDLLDEADDPISNSHINGVTKGCEWLSMRTASLANQKSGLDASELQGQILAMLASDSNGAARTLLE